MNEYAVENYNLRRLRSCVSKCSLFYTIHAHYVRLALSISHQVNTPNCQKPKRNVKQEAFNYFYFLKSYVDHSPVVVLKLARNLIASEQRPRIIEQKELYQVRSKEC